MLEDEVGANCQVLVDAVEDLAWRHGSHTRRGDHAALGAAALVSCGTVQEGADVTEVSAVGAQTCYGERDK